MEPEEATDLIPLRDDMSSKNTGTVKYKDRAGRK
jgi:hypothetical protein